MVWSSLAIITVWEKGSAFTKVKNPFEREDSGINTPQKIPTRDIKIEEIGPVCFSLEQMIPIIIPKVMYKSADGIKYIMLKIKLTLNGNLNIKAIAKNKIVWAKARGSDEQTKLR